MSGDRSKDKLPIARLVLSDVTNCPTKRGFSLISSDLGLKPRDGYGKNIDVGDDDLHLVKRRCLGVENIVDKKCRHNDIEKDKSLLKGKEACGLMHPYTGINCSQESITSAMPKLSGEVKETSSMLEDNSNPAKGDVASQSVLEVGDASRDSSVSAISIPTYSGLSNGIVDCQDEERVSPDASQSDHVSEGLATCISRSCEDLGVGRLGSSSYGSVDWLRLPKSQGSKVFSLERCTGDNAEGCANLNDAYGMLRACTCSFCLKAAYIWSDLHYQDIKGRIAALKKSQKEASVLVQNSCRGKDVDIHGEGNSNESSKLESDLNGQWRSLFLHMEDILIRESNQLQAGFVTLKDLRENCKMDLEMINVMPLDKK